MRVSPRLPPSLRKVRSASFLPRGANYDARRLLRTPIVVFRGGEDALALRFAVRAGAVAVELFAQGRCSSEDEERAFRAARGVAAVDDDPTEFLTMARLHPIVAELARRYDARLSRTPTLFESFAVTVIEQLVTTWEAWQSIRRLWAIAGEAVPGTRLRAAPRPEAVRAVPMWKLRAIGIGARRAATLNMGAKRGETIERLATLAPEVVVEKLESLPGVGPWTANLVARSALGYTDAVPIGDCHAPYVVTGALTGEEGGDEAMLEALEPFRPHRARVVVLLDRAQFARRRTEGVPRRRLPRVDPHRREPWKY